MKISRYNPLENTKTEIARIGEDLSGNIINEIVKINKCTNIINGKHLSYLKKCSNDAKNIIIGGF